MPEIWADGEKKKVACGPCIRGHRSSKCTHKDRVLIAVRKPGRPLSACPHGTASCQCQRVVQYTIPAASDCPCPQTVSYSSPVTASNSRVQKPRVKKSGPSSTTSNVQKAFGDPNGSSVLDLQQLATSVSDSSNVPSLASSSSSTPQLNAVDMRGNCMQHATFPEIKAETEDVQNRTPMGDPRTMGALSNGPYLGYSAPIAPSSCCAPQYQPEEPIEMGPPRSCCNPGPSEHPRRDSQQGPRPGQQGTDGQFDSFNLALPNFTSPVSGFSALDQDPNIFFQQMEGRYGACHGEIPGHSGARESGGCHCGANCSCLGCSTHPANFETQKYVRLHDQLYFLHGMSPQMQPAPNPYQQQSSFLNADSHYGELNPGDHQTVFQTHVDPQFSMDYGSASGYVMQSSVQPSWQGQSAIEPMMTPTHELQKFHLQDQSSVLSSIPQQYNHDSRVDHRLTSDGLHTPGTPVHNAATGQIHFELPHRTAIEEESDTDHDSPSTVLTMSPSTFQMQQITYEECSERGDCQCGNCKCNHSTRENSSNINAALPETTLGGTDLNGFDIDSFHATKSESG